MKLDPGMHIGMHLVSFGKSGVTRRGCARSAPGEAAPARTPVRPRPPGDSEAAPARPPTGVTTRTSGEARVDLDAATQSALGKKKSSFFILLTCGPYMS
jgi:hypothetical protein